jgi:hypothetical protein
LRTDQFVAGDDVKILVRGAVNPWPSNWFDLYFHFDECHVRNFT